jgi:hypothetical protein
MLTGGMMLYQQIDEGWCRAKQQQLSQAATGSEVKRQTEFSMQTR